MGGESACRFSPPIKREADLVNPKATKIGDIGYTGAFIKKAPKIKPIFA